VGSHAFYYSVPRLLLLTLFSALAFVFFVFASFGTLHTSRMVFVMLVLAAAMVGWMLVSLIRQLIHAREPALVLDAERLIFRSGSHRKEILLCEVKAVGLLRPSSNQIGNTLYIEMHSRLEGGQRGWPTFSVPLALIVVRDVQLLELIASYVVKAGTPCAA